MTATPTSLMISSGRMTVDPSTEHSKLLAALRLNTDVTATVVRTLSARQVQLTIAGQRVVADTYLPLQPGSRLLLKVVQTDPAPVLKILEAAGPPTSGGMPGMRTLSLAGDPFACLAQLLAPTGRLPDQPAGQGAGLARLTDLMASLALKSTAADPTLLERLMVNGGILWEGKLAAAMARTRAPAPERIRQMAAQDLKAAALQLLPEIAGDGQARARVEAFLEGLETLHLLNRHTADAAGRFILPLPVLWDEGLQFGQLLLDLNREASGGGAAAQKVTRVSLLLTLSRLGPLRGDFGIWQKTVTGTFGVADAESAGIVCDHLPRLTQALHRSGFSVGRIDCRVLGRATLAGTSLAEEALSAGQSGLNLVV
ncbi:MAG: flagellar hook-length control protein FliK [Desulfobacterales bacterium]